MQAVWMEPEEKLTAAVPEPHWYVDMVAVEPNRQGTGVGSALLQAIHARTDGDGLPIALFTVQPRNSASVNGTVTRRLPKGPSQ